MVLSSGVATGDGVGMGGHDLSSQNVVLVNFHLQEISEIIKIIVFTYKPSFADHYQNLLYAFLL